MLPSDILPSGFQRFAIRKQAMGTEDVKESFSLSLCGPSSISRANAHMVHMG